MAEGTVTEELERQIIALAPWHIDVDVTPEISTGSVLEVGDGSDGSEGPEGAGPVRFVRPRKTWDEVLQRIYPNGLEGRRFMECACNCGAYTFWAKEMGAGDCYGFDVRDHWINQAEFLLEHRTFPSDGIKFEVNDLYDLPKAGMEPFDVTMFQGIFYHLPDPITGLKAAADLTSELLIFDTAIRDGMPDGMLALAEESRTQVMSGVYGLNWFPTGPVVLERILRWLGFVEVKLVHWRVNRRGRRGNVGRVRILASRKEGLLAGIQTVSEPRSQTGAELEASEDLESADAEQTQTQANVNTSGGNQLEPDAAAPSISEAFEETDRTLRRLLRYLREANPEPAEELAQEMRRAKRQLRANRELLGEAPDAKDDGSSA